MKYEELAKAVEGLSYRDKFRLAQLLIQLGRKQEEEEYPQQRPTTGSNSAELTAYVAERINKLRPTKKDGLTNSINAMFQFQGGISDSDRNKIIEALQKKKLSALVKQAEFHITNDFSDRIKIKPHFWGLIFYGILLY